MNAVKYPKAKDYSWQEFCAKIMHPVVTVGTTWAVYKGLPERPARENGKIIDYNEETQWGIKSKAGGAVFGELIIPDGKEISRKKEYFPKRSAICFDYENCTAEIFDRVKKALQQYSYCYHTTCNCRLPDDVRIHVIIPFIEPIDWELYSIIAVELARAIGLQGLDVSCLERSHMENYCVSLRDNPYLYHIHNAEFLDGEKYLMEKYGTLDAKEITEKAGIAWKEFKIPDMEKYNRKEKETVSKAGKINVKFTVGEFSPGHAIAGNVKSCFNHVFSCNEILDLLPSMYIPCGNRYTYFKGSGFGGVWVSIDGTRCGSHHSNSGDPLCNGHSWTAFDLYVEFFGGEGNFNSKMKKAHQYAREKKGDKYEKIYYGKKIKIGR